MPRYMVLCDRARMTVEADEVVVRDGHLYFIDFIGPKSHGLTRNVIVFASGFWQMYELRRDDEAENFEVMEE